MGINCKKWRNTVGEIKVSMAYCNSLFSNHKDRNKGVFDVAEDQYKKLLERVKGSLFYFNDEFRTISSGQKVTLREPGQGDKKGREVVLNIRKKQRMEDGTIVQVGDKLEEVGAFPKVKQTIEVIGFSLDNDNIIIKSLVGNPVRLVEIREIRFDGVGEAKSFRKI